MKTKKSKLIIGKEDFETLNAYVRGLKSMRDFDRKNAASLEDELKKATVLKKKNYQEML